MATQATASVSRDRTAELLAALARAKAERLVAYPTRTPGLWECKDYHIRETGPRPQERGRADQGDIRPVDRHV